MISLIQRYKNRRLRAMMRGYRILKNNKQQQFIYSLKNMLTHTKLHKINKSDFFGNHIPDVEISLRQFLYAIFLGNYKINKAILYSVGSQKPLRFPLNKTWRDAIKKEGVKIDLFSCWLLWVGYVFLIWGYGVIQGVGNISFILNNRRRLGKYIYFDGLSANNLPIDGDFGYNIIEWYLNWENKRSQVDSIIHTAKKEEVKYKGINIVNYPNAMPRLTILNKLIYVGLFFYNCIFSFMAMLLGKYQYGILLNEVVKLTQVRLAKPKDLAEDYLFHNSGIIYRPLWTYEAEKKGSRIIFYFYSVGIDKWGVHNDPYHLMSWSHYLAWNNCQKKFLLKYVSYSSDIEVVGVIWFSDLNIKVPILDNHIAVFDIQPSRTVTCRLLSIDFAEYTTPITVNKFIEDIHCVAVEDHWSIAHKRKRMHNNLHLKYKKLIKYMSKQDGYQAINPDSAATNLIKNTQATISMPFTSTALIAKEEGKPSIYYDPIGIIDKDDEAAHGIPVLSGIDELREWVQNLDR